MFLKILSDGFSGIWMAVSGPWPTRFNYPYLLTHGNLSHAGVCCKWTCVPFVKSRVLCRSSWLVIKNSVVSSLPTWEKKTHKTNNQKTASWYPGGSPYKWLLYEILFVTQWNMISEAKLAIWAEEEVTEMPCLDIKRTRLSLKIDQTFTIQDLLL